MRIRSKGTTPLVGSVARARDRCGARASRRYLAGARSDGRILTSIGWRRRSRPGAEELEWLLTREGVELTGTPASRRALPEIAASELTVDQVEAEIVIALPARGRERHASEKIETACSDVCGIEPLTGPPRGRARRAHRRGLTRSRRTPVALGAPHSARSEMLGQFHRLPGLRTSRVLVHQQPVLTGRRDPILTGPVASARASRASTSATACEIPPPKASPSGSLRSCSVIAVLSPRRRALADSRSATPLARSRTTRAIAASRRASAIRRIDLDRSILEDLLRRRTSL